MNSESDISIDCRSNKSLIWFKDFIQQGWFSLCKSFSSSKAERTKLKTLSVVCSIFNSLL